MGEAKRRGTFEQRKAAAIERDTHEREWGEKERARKLAAMPPAQRRSLQKSNLFFAQMLVIAAMAGSARR